MTGRGGGGGQNIQKLEATMASEQSKWQVRVTGPQTAGGGGEEEAGTRRAGGGRDA